ncbi:hypothetical protein J6P92_01760 [bacterium]|nr:hypothetical protein [bacterium]
MYIQPLNSSNSVAFGLKVTVDKRILKSTNEKNSNVINNLVHELSGIRKDTNVRFDAVQDSNGNIVNVSHIEDGDKLPSLYKENKPLVVDDFIRFLDEKREWYETRFLNDRAVEDAFG